MVVLRFSMQGEDILAHTNGKCHVFIFSTQLENIIEHNTENYYVFYF
jgi:hypothetical protein